MSDVIRIDFASEGCQWEVPSDGQDCPRRGAGMIGEWLGIYCTEHLAAWEEELERQHERDKPKLPGMQDWYRRMAKQEARQ